MVAIFEQRFEILKLAEPLTMHTTRSSSLCFLSCFSLTQLARICPIGCLRCVRTDGVGSVLLLVLGYSLSLEDPEAVLWGYQTARMTPREGQTECRGLGAFDTL